MKQNIIAVDFDGTLCENKWPEIGMPNVPYSELIMNAGGLDDNSINALQGAVRNSSKGYIYKRKTED